MLVQTSAGAYLNADAAASYEVMNASFTRDLGYRLSISSGARTHQQQINAFTDNYNPFYTVAELGRVERRWWNGRWWYRKPWRATVAVPGYSNHEYPPGRAADFGSGVQSLGTAGHNWMLRWAGDFGWEWTGRNFSTLEPWHWEKTKPMLANAGGGATPFPQPKPEPVDHTPKYASVIINIANQ